jgi:hypothetical protein
LIRVPGWLFGHGIQPILDSSERQWICSRRAVNVP